MFAEMSKNWWMFLVRGLIAVVFGVLVMVWPNQAWSTLMVVLGAFALLAGVFTLIAGIASARFFDGWWALLLDGLAGIAVGVFMLSKPTVASQVALYALAAWAVISGIFQVVVATKIQKYIQGDKSMLVAGILSIVCGVLLFVSPASGSVAIAWVVGIYAILFGIMQIVFSYRLHALRGQTESSGSAGM